MLPIGSSRRRLLNQPTHSSVAYSTASKLRQGPARMDHLGLEQPVDRLGEGMVVAVADTADLWFDALADCPVTQNMGHGGPKGASQEPARSIPRSGGRARLPGTDRMMPGASPGAWPVSSSGPDRPSVAGRFPARTCPRRYGSGSRLSVCLPDPASGGHPGGRYW